MAKKWPEMVVNSYLRGTFVSDHSLYQVYGMWFHVHTKNLKQYVSNCNLVSRFIIEIHYVIGLMGFLGRTRHQTRGLLNGKNSAENEIKVFCTLLTLC